MELYIDINGVTEPNRIGIDLFRFFVDDNGMIIPYGGTVYNDYIGKGYDAEPLYMSEDDNACYVDDDGKEHVGNGGTCSGYIADNNWKVLY